MNRIQLKNGIELSQIVYGMWRLGDDTDTSPAHVQAKVEKCLEQGITTMDQADIYGDYASETILGEMLKTAPHLKDKIEIVTKCDIMLLSEKFPERRVKYYDTSKAHIEASVENSLRLMNVDVLDLLLIHRPDPLMDHRETGAALDSLIASGKVKSVGVSNFKPHDWNLLQSAMENALVTNQIELSLLAHDGFTNGDVAFNQQHDIPMMAWSPLAGGQLVNGSRANLQATLKRVGDQFGVDETAVAVAWLLRHPAQIMPVMGTNSLDRIENLSDALKVEMDRETWFELYTEAVGNEVP